jgi:hypothetical protein
MSPTSESRALTSKNICILLCIHHCTCWHGRLRGRIDRLRGRIGAVVEIRNYEMFRKMMGLVVRVRRGLLRSIVDLMTS